MGNANAARRRVQERARPPDAAAVIAKIEHAVAEASAIHARIRQREHAIADIIAELGRVGAGDIPRYLALGENLAGLLAFEAEEIMADAAHCEEARRQAEALAPLIAFTPVMFQAAVAEGRRMEAEERDQARRARPPGGRHARRHLRAIPGVPAAAVRAAAAGVVVAGLSGSIVAVHEESSVRAVAAAPARHAAHRMVPDRAVAVPRRAPSPRPSAAAASASPAPAAAPRPPVPTPAGAPPPAPVTAAPAPVLVVPRLLDLGGSIFGQLPLSAAGADGVEWTATATDGIRLSQYQGVVVRGQDVTLTVTDGPATGGMIYISAGRVTYPVEVTSALGPVLALPSGL